MITEPTPSLNPLDAPLEGIALIEAAAGTGKTYTITGLYLRLVLEGGYGVDQILVITYTRAATAELRERIRSRLAGVREALRLGGAIPPFEAALIERSGSRGRALRLLNDALSNFDRAAIHTIHGFCQRILTDHAFESALPFEIEVLADEREVLQGIVEDFWRRTFYPASPLFIDYICNKRLTPDKLFEWVQPHIAKPFLRIIAPHQAPDAEFLETAFVGAFRQVREQCRRAQTEVLRLLHESPGLRRNTYREATVVRLGRLLETELCVEWPSIALFSNEKRLKDLELLTTTGLAASLKKNTSAPEHPLFDACDELVSLGKALLVVYEERLRGLQHQLLQYCNDELERRKQVLSRQSYNDLLNHLERALHGDSGERLARSLQHRFPAALVDEFQDTDPIQFAILERVYRRTNLPVFLVGDPKQAIYGFRGADVFAYLGARRDSQRTFALAANWRSTPALVRAINVLFANVSRPFVVAEIGFFPSTAANNERPPLVIDNEAITGAFHIWFLERGTDAKPITKTLAKHCAIQATAAEVARLLNLGARGAARIGDRPLTGGDIAILVRTHRQGRAVRTALLALGVPSVQHVQESVFQSPQAADVERLLLAVAEPTREHLVKGALTTDLLGESAETLYELSQDDIAWARRLDQFQGWHELWRDQGFIRMFRHVLVSERVAARLLAFADGERRLTNVLHLAELLERASLRRHLGMDGLVAWLAERREACSMAVEDEQLRLETDQHLVKVVTVHKSKGLEYSIVFCPFLWDGRALSGAADTLAFHDRRDNFQATLFLGFPPPAEAQRWAEEEELAESLRLLYVALTRACYRCYLVWGAANGAEISPLAWLLHRPSERQAKLTIPAVAEHFKSQSDNQLLADLARLAEAAEGAIQVQPIAQTTPEPFAPPADRAASIAPRLFTGSIRPGWRMTSFSALAHQQGAELPDYDAGVLLPKYAPPVEDAMSIHDFPKGAEAGQCLHTIFERLDFSACVPQLLQEVVERALLEHGFSIDWVATVAEAVMKVLATPLDDGGEIRLQNVPNCRRLNELEFHYPIAGLEATALRQILRQSESSKDFLFEEGLRGHSFFTGSGFMKGFIDLVFQAGTRFYIVDYKSNWLGPDQSAYAREYLSAVMAREAYSLQYLLYTVAVHRYLAQRLPDYQYDTHFGGAFYLFLRGMAPATGPAFGVFADRPCKKLVTTLDRYLSTGTAERVE